MRNFVLLAAFRQAAPKIAMRCAVLLLFFSTSLMAQQPRALDKKISFKVDNSPLSEALRKFKELTGVHMTFNQDDVKQQPNVTVNLSNRTGRDILEKILSGSNLLFVEGTAGNVLIVQKKDKKESTRGEKYFDVNGQVVDQNNNPLSQATIMLMPEKKGYSADNKGMFNLTAKENDVLVFSYLGMKSSEVTIKKDGFIKVALDTAPAVMTEYVVTGYQVVDKRMLTGSAVVLTPDKFITAGAASVDQMLQGKVPGMAVTFNSGSPSATPKIRIRGTSTVIGNAAPLWVVDGIVRTDPVNLNPLQVNALLSGAQESNFSMAGNAISGINPYDIESITFLKDAAATSIYGVQAANGVIVVKTKRGKPGPATVSYNVDLGFTARPNYNRLYLMNSKERIETSKELIGKGIYYSNFLFTVGYEQLYNQLTSRQITQEEFSQKVGQLETMNTDWFDLLAQNAFNHTHSVSISGGSGKSVFYSSLSYNDAKGSFKGDDVKRYTGRMNMESQINSRLTVSLMLDASYRKANGFFKVNPYDYALQASRAISADSFYVAQIATGDRNTRGAGNPLRYNIFNELSQTGSSSTTQSASLIANITYKLWKGLSFQGSYSYALSNYTNFSYITARSYAAGVIRQYDYNAYKPGDNWFEFSGLPYGGLAYPSNLNSTGLQLRNQLNYNLNLFGGRDQFTAMVTQEIRSDKTNGQSSSEPGYYPERGNTYYTDWYNTRTRTETVAKHYVEPTNTINNVLSWLGNISYRLNRKYTISANIRSDGSNRFGQYSNQKFLPNWSVGARWDLSSEKWFDKVQWIEQLAIRGSYGTQGTVVSQVSPQLIASYPRNPVDPGTGEFILDLKSLPYPDLRWEKTKSWNIGADITLLKGRVVIAADAYYRKTTDLLLSREIPQEYGVAVMYMNAGDVSNAGWDANLTVVPVKSRKFEWTQSFVYGMNYNKIVESGVVNNLISYINGGATVPGKPIGSFYSYAFTGLSSVNGVPMYDFMEKEAGFKKTDPSTWLQYSGRIDPVVDFSTSSTLRYKAFTLNAIFVLKLGFQRRLNPLYPNQAGYIAPPPDMNLSRELANRWRQPGDEAYTNIPGYANVIASAFLPGVMVGTVPASSPYALYDNSSIRVVNGDFLRCTNLNLAYSLPRNAISRIGAKGMDLRISVNNPFIITNKAFRGQDPETSNIGSRSLPITASWYMSINVTF